MRHKCIGHDCAGHDYLGNVDYLLIVADGKLRWRKAAVGPDPGESVGSYLTKGAHYSEQ